MASCHVVCDVMCNFSKEELKTQDMLLNGEAIYMEQKSPSADSDPNLKVTLLMIICFVI